MQRVATIVIGNLKEAVFDDSKKTVTIPVLRECVSKNGYKYSKEIVEAFVPLLGAKKKMYADHSVNQRKITEWAATIQKQWYDDGRAYVECKFTSPFAWLYEEAKSNPDEVSVSIDAVAVVEEIKDGDKNIFVVKRWVRAKSVDFVTENSVPGARVEKVNESLKSFVIFEAITDTLQYRMDQIKDRRDKWEYKYDILGALTQFMNELTTVDPEDSDVRKEVESQCDELVDLLLKIPEKYDDLWMGGDNIEIGDDEINVQEIKKKESDGEYPASAYLYTPDKSKSSTWKLRYKKYEDGKLVLSPNHMGAATAALGKGYRGKKVQLPQDARNGVKAKLRSAYKKLNKDVPDSLKENLGDDMDFTIEDVLGNQEVFNAIKKMVVEETEKGEEVKKLQDDLKALKEQVKTLTDDKINLQGKLDVKEAEEKKLQLEKFLNEQLNEYKLSDVVSDEWKKVVMENATEDTIKIHVQAVKKVRESDSTKVDDLQADDKGESNEDTIVDAKSDIFDKIR